MGKHIQTYVPRETFIQLKELALTNEITLGELLRRIIYSYLQFTGKEQSNGKG